MESDFDFEERGVANGRLTFAFKLWEVANDGRLIKWNSSGDGVIVEQREYEEFVQYLYPRFVQTSGFLNLKRLFRDYGFKSNVLRKKKPHGLKIEYINPLFRRDNYENIIHLTAKERVYKYRSRTSSSGYSVYKARRKYTRKFPTHQSVFDSGCSKIPSRHGGYASRRKGNRSSSLPHPTPSSSFSHDSTIGFPSLPRKRGRPRKHFYNYNNLQSEISQTPSLTLTLSADTSFSDIFSEGGSAMQDREEKLTLTEADKMKLFQILAKNELSEEMYVEAVLRKFGDRFEHLDLSFDDLVSAIDEMLDQVASPFCYSQSFREYSLDEM